jgi:hypothetical protein
VAMYEFLLRRFAFTRLIFGIKTHGVVVSPAALGGRSLHADKV